MWPFSRGAGAPVFSDIEPREAYRRIKQGSLLLDVRQPDELSGGRFPKAVNVPLNELAAYADDLDPSAPVMLVCRSGSRSRRGAKTLARLGFSDVSNIRGGVNAWRRAGLPLKAAKRR